MYKTMLQFFRLQSTVETIENKGLKQEIEELKKIHEQQTQKLKARITDLVLEIRPKTLDQETTTDTPEETWRRMFPKWTAANLETEGIYRVGDQGYSFVVDVHPIIYVLERSECGDDIRKQLKIDGHWHRIGNEVIITTVTHLRNAMPVLYG